MEIDRLKYFRIVKKLNEQYHEVLKRKEIHFRGNENSFSLISISQKSPELGVKKGLKSELNIEKIIETYNNNLENPGRLTEEKSLQAYIIKKAIDNNMKLPFGDFTFITSEFAYKLKNNKRIVNDILAVDSKNNLVIIELKSKRNNSVKQQTIDFEEKVIKKEIKFFKELIKLMTCKDLNKKVRKVAIWKKFNTENYRKENKFSEVELFNYTFEGNINLNQITMEKVTFSKE